MVKKAALVILLLAWAAAPVRALDISGEYNVKVKGSNVILDRSPASQRIGDNTTLTVDQQGDSVTMTFGAFGGVSPATIFKGKAGNDRFAAVWWYQGSDHETKVIWGTVRNKKLHGRMIYPRVAGRDSLVPGWVEIDFEANPKMVIKPVKPMGKVEKVPSTDAVDIGKEDCLAFDPKKVKLQAESGRYLLTDGRSRMKVFPDQKEARQALNVIRHYRLNQHCFVGRPDPSMEYWLANGQAPTGSTTGEDCIGFDPARLELRPEGSQWLMTDGRSRMRVFPNKNEAEQALAVIRNYGFSQTCYIGRPDPSMTYFRK